MGGQIDTVMEPIATGFQMIASGRVQALAYSGPTRFAALPDAVGGIAEGEDGEDAQLLRDTEEVIDRLQPAETASDDHHAWQLPGGLAGRCGVQSGGRSGGN